MTDNASLLDLQIVRREEQAQGIISLDLVAPNGGRLPPFDAGAHIDVQIAPGLVRQYSLCGDPATSDRYRLGILLDPASRGGSAAIHRDFQAGKLVRASAPRNHFPLAGQAVFSVLIGGGIGVTPLIAMAYQLSAKQAPFALHYCTRSRENTAFSAELERSVFAPQICLHHDDQPEQRFVPERDLPPPSANIHLYICGPAGFMDWVIASARAHGYPETAIHREYFAADIDTAGGPFEVVAARSGRTVRVAEGQSIAQALTLAGVSVDVACEEGVCGTCLTALLEGTPDHRDVFLTEEERQANDQILLCCSRAKTPRLVIDL